MVRLTATTEGFIPQIKMSSPRELWRFVCGFKFLGLWLLGLVFGEFGDSDVADFLPVFEVWNACAALASRKSGIEGLNESFSFRALHNAWVYRKEIENSENLLKTMNARVHG